MEEMAGADALIAPIEALLLAAEAPLGPGEIAEVFERVERTPVSPLAVRNALQVLARQYEARGGGVWLAEVAGGFELRTRQEFAAYVQAMYKRRPVKLSRAALEVLAIVAYRQPCTRADVDDIRGVDSSSSLRALLERRLIKILGKADDVGRPLLYGTTPEFLSLFGLTSLTDLPTLKEFTELTDEHVVKLQELDATLAANLRSGGGAPAQTELPTDDASAYPGERVERDDD